MLLCLSIPPSRLSELLALSSPFARSERLKDKTKATEDAVSAARDSYSLAESTAKRQLQTYSGRQKENSTSVMMEALSRE